MYRTHLFLLRYGLPLLLLVGMGLALWQIQVPWYLAVVLLPVAALLIVILVGSVALARERRAARRSVSQHPSRDAQVAER